jgi:hypothetical protein
MGIIASILGGIGGLCAVIGIVTALEVMPDIGDQFTWMFWFVLSAILLLGSIAIAVGRGGSYD